MQTETIAAISTPAGQGGVGIVRISGPRAFEICQSITGRSPQVREVMLCRFLDQSRSEIDSGVVLCFEAPASYTGEHVVELQGHGGPAILDVVLNRVISLGSRLARPGEFTERAFLNGKLDLAQAEAVSDIIASGSEAAARAAVRSLSGVFSSKINALSEQLINLRIYIEAALDFAEEEIDFLSSEELSSRANELQESFSHLMSETRQGRLLREGMTIVIAGAPNAGKSSLLNVLAGFESAIVTDIAGTTRDVLREHIQIDGLPLKVIDTAGFHNTNDPVEKEGIKRAREAIADADRLLWVIDSTQNASSVGLDDNLSSQKLDVDLQRQLAVAGIDTAELPAGLAIDRIMNKCDLMKQAASITTISGITTLNLCARTGEGVDLLKAHLKQTVGFQNAEEGVFIARRRHLDALQRASEATERGLQQLRVAGHAELAAEDFREAQNALGEITGQFTSDDLLGRIFAGFCIGK